MAKKLTRTRVRCGVALVAALLAFVSPAASRRHGIEILLLPSQNGDSPGMAEWKLGAPVQVLVRVINNTKRVVHFGETYPGWEYEMDVRDGRGRPVPETDAYRKIKEDFKKGPEFVLRSSSVTLQPHQSVPDDGIDVSYFYKLDHPDRYTIRISRMIRDFSKKPVWSNRLVLNVNP